MQRNVLTALAAARMPRGAFAPAFSPDGRLLNYIQDTRSAPANDPALETCIWDVGTKRLVARVRGHQPAWSPDSQRLAFARDGQVCVGARDGAGATPTGVGSAPRWHPEGTGLFWTREEHGKTVLVRASVGDMETPEKIADICPEGLWALSPDGRRLAYVHVQPNPERLGGLPEYVVQIGEVESTIGLRLIDLESNQSVIVADLPAGVQALYVSLEWSPDASTLAYAWTSPWKGITRLQRYVCLWRPDQKRAQPISIGESVALSRPSWSPDGRRLALLANPWGHFAADDFGWLTVFDVGEGSVVGQCRDLAATTAPKWSPDGEMVMSRIVGNAQQPYSAFSAQGEFLRHLTPDGYYCSAADLSPDGSQLAVSLRSFSGLNEIYLCPVEESAPVCITSTSQALDAFGLPDVWIHEWVTPDGLAFEGIVIEPKQASGRGAPLLVWPDANERGWNICYLEINWGLLAHWMAQCGYRVFIPSNRLAGAAGLEHLTRIWRITDVAADVAAGVRSLRERLPGQGPAVALGLSGGGDLICELLVSQPDLLAAAVVAGIHPDYASVYSMGATGNPLMQETFGGPPWERPQQYLDASPMRGLAHVQAPLLIMQGSEDASSPSARHFYTALREANKDVTYLEFKGQGHGPEEPKRVAAYFETAVRWLGERLFPQSGARREDL